MNKTAIRNFAVWARNKLINDVTYRAGLMGVTANGIADPLPQSTDNMHFFDIGMSEPYQITAEEMKQRKGLVEIIKRKEKDSDYATAFSSVVEEVAYTWFNRLIAIRFMEVNDYLPSHIRVLSSESGKLEPDLVTTPYDADLLFANSEEQIVQKLKNENKLDEVFRLLFIKQCNSLHEILPKLFENLSDYTELLLNVSYIDQDGVVAHLINDIPEEDFNVELGGQVEIIGWLYQYYNAELKDETFALLKQNVKVTKERVPAVTQLFTPDWIVRYMVENSLGRLWTRGHYDTSLRSGWKYYINEAEQEGQVQIELDKINSEYAKLNPEDIKFIDPCMGSGHILVYAFEVFMQIYESAGYTQRDAVKSIVENNIFGLDIDDRAAQLAYFAVMMKARQYNRRILGENIKCNVMAVQESNGFDRACLCKLGDLQAVGEKLIDTFLDAKEYGSILKVDISLEMLDALKKKLDEIDRKADYDNIFDEYESRVLINELTLFINQAKIMVQKYDVVVTNPPYRAVADCSDKLISYSKNNYPDSKNDLATICMERTLEMCKNIGFMAMINIPMWMSKSSFENLRYKILSDKTIDNMLHCGRGIFGSDFGTVAFVVNNSCVKGYKATFRQLFEEIGNVDSVEKKEEWFFDGKGLFEACPDKFLKISSYPIAYWVSDRLLTILNECEPLEVYADARKGLTTGDNDTFARLWFEIEENKFSLKNTKKKWFPMTKGGDFRRWYGNNTYVVNWENDGHEIINFKDEKGKLRSRPQNVSYYFREGISWNDTTATGKIAFRYQNSDFIPNASGPCVYTENNLWYLFGLLNSVVSQKLLEILAPNMKFEVGQMALVPIIYKDDERVDILSNENVQIEKEDWDSFERSWDFKKHPLI